MKACIRAIVCAALAVTWTSTALAQLAEFVTPELHERALTTLESALRDQADFVKVHAAEALLELDYGAEVRPVFEQELARDGGRPVYRVGIWRVLARAANSRADAQPFLDRLLAVAIDSTSPDQAHAIESLAKLRAGIPASDRAKLEQLTLKSPADEVCLRWLLANSGSAADEQALADYLKAPDPEARGLAAYALSESERIDPAVVNGLLVAARGDEGPCQLIASAAQLAPNAAEAAHFKSLLLQFTGNTSKADRYHAALALAECGVGDDVPLLSQLLTDLDPDVRVAAASAILRIERRRPPAFNWLDWFVLIGYGIGMLAIGAYYSRAESVDEYLLGGRTMKPWAVGVSLFATLMSTLTYLAVPGEMIRHGPMVMAAVLSLPFAYVVVGRYIIPFIMRLRITSAYEILEQRLGLSVRMLGSTIFLLIRMLWMALIVYATSAEVLVPLLHLDASSTPWVSIVVVILTVIYTSMGGLKAVVVTDVVQTLIMFVGAIVSITMITYSLGGVSAWWPTEWKPEWDPPSLFFAPDMRVSAGMALVSQLVWYVCTVGSDQMAIQRYLATRDAPAARRMFGVSLWCSAFIYLLLGAFGFALLAYFRANPHMLPDGETVTSGADQLLSHYIAYVLPPGLSGLVVAGILSAAMDSLSSGINSSCSVITVDFIDRFRRSQVHGVKHVQEAKFVSWLIGGAVIVLSLLTTLVPGNLLEKCYTVVNLFVAPLFSLFFMAMFVPWATPVGTWMAAIAGIAVALALAYGNFLGLGFLWIMPVSLVVSIVAGCVGSWLPIGPAARPMLEKYQADPLETAR